MRTFQASIAISTSAEQFMGLPIPRHTCHTKSDLDFRPNECDFLAYLWLLSHGITPVTLRESAAPGGMWG